MIASTLFSVGFPADLSSNCHQELLHFTHFCHRLMDGTQTAPLDFQSVVRLLPDLSGSFPMPPLANEIARMMAEKYLSGHHHFESLVSLCLSVSICEQASNSR